jgi:hypothetical protein
MGQKLNNLGLFHTICFPGSSSGSAGEASSPGSGSSSPAATNRWRGIAANIAKLYAPGRSYARLRIIFCRAIGWPLLPMLAAHEHFAGVRFPCGLRSKGLIR